MTIGTTAWWCPDCEGQQNELRKHNGAEEEQEHPDGRVRGRVRKGALGYRKALWVGPSGFGLRSWKPGRSAPRSEDTNANAQTTGLARRGDRTDVPKTPNRGGVDLLPSGVLSGLASDEVPFGGNTMAKLIYIANTSLDGYCEDRDGGIDFGDPDEEYFSFINDLERPVGTYLYGRRMYEAMIYWETAPIADQPSWVVDFTNIWRAADKIVFSKTLASVSSASTTLKREFNVEAIRQLKADAPDDLTVGGADLAAQAFGAGLVDECHLFFWPLC